MHDRRIWRAFGTCTFLEVYNLTKKTRLISLLGVHCHGIAQPYEV